MPILRKHGMQTTVNPSVLGSRFLFHRLLILNFGRDRRPAGRTGTTWCTTIGIGSGTGALVKPAITVRTKLIVAAGSWGLTTRLKWLPPAADMRSKMTGKPPIRRWPVLNLGVINVFRGKAAVAMITRLKAQVADSSFMETKVRL